MELKIHQRSSIRERNRIHARIIQSVMNHRRTQSDSRVGPFIVEHLRYTLSRWRSDTGATAVYERYRERAAGWLK